MVSAGCGGGGGGVTTLLVDLSSVYFPNAMADIGTAHDYTVDLIVREADKFSDTVVCCDSGRSFRKDIDPNYKAQREERDPSIYREMKRVQETLVAAGFGVAFASGFEADDVLATMAARIPGEVAIATQDKDLMALVGDRVRVLSTRTGQLFGRDEVRAKYGVWPEQISEWLMLTGDSSDNIAGVPGIGPKRAAQLLETFGSIRGIYDAIGSGKVALSEKITHALAASWDTVELARRLVTLRTDAPIEFIGGEEPQEAAPAVVAVPVETAKEERVTMALPAKQQATPTTGGRLGAVKRGKVALAQRFLIYGGEGTGKSTLASGAPSPIWLDIEGGSIHLDVARYPFGDGPMGHVPSSYGQVVSALDELINTQHDFKTVVVDTADKLEPMVWTHVVAQANSKDITSIEDFGWGKGYTAAADVWRELMRRFDDLRSRGIHVIILAHAQVKTFKNPSGDDFDRYQLRLNEKAGGLLKDWADVVGFLTHDEWAKKDKNAPRAKGYGSGRRILNTERTAAFDAKTRLPLSKEIEIAIADPWGPIAAAIAAVTDANPDDLLKQIGAELVRIGDEALTNQVRAACVPVATDATALARYLQDLKGRPSKAASEQTAA